MALFIITAAGCAALSSVSDAWAQSLYATLGGVIVDETDAAIPDARITVLSLETGLQRQTQTTAAGTFVVPLLPPGRYSVTAQREGFSGTQVRELVLNVNDQTRIQLQLKIANVGEKVSVVAEPSRVSTSSAVSTVIDRQFVENLPLNGRSLHTLFLLTPGAVVTGGRGLFSVNGQRSGTNYFTVDGVSANTGVVAATGPFQGLLAGSNGDSPAVSASGITTSMVSVDALEEFRIQTSTYSAEYGRQPGAQVQLVTRSGTNRFHGSLYEYWRHEALDANDWFANRNGRPKQERRQNQFGGTFGGPVLLPRLFDGRNQTFFFVSHESQRLRLPATYNATVPSLRAREMAAPALRPLFDAFPLPDGPETLDEDGRQTGNAPLFFADSSPTTSDATSVRLDHILNGKLTMLGRYNYAPSNSQIRDLHAITNREINTHGVTLGATMIFAPSFSNELRFNYTRADGVSGKVYDTWGGAVPIDQNLLLGGYSGPGRKLGYGQVTPPGSDSSYQLEVGDFASTFQQQFHLVNNVSLMLDRHRFKVGVDYRRLAPTLAPIGYYQLTQANTPDAVTGGTASVYIQTQKEVRPRYDNFSAYVQDTWQALPRLTLDLGLRWEVNPAPGDANGLEPLLLRGVRSNDDILAGRLELAPSGTPLYETFWRGLAPRVGAAWLVSNVNGLETVVRGGFGFFYDLGNGRAVDPFGGFPFSAGVSYQNVTFPLPSALAVPPSYPEVTLAAVRDTSMYALNPEMKLPYSLQWNTSIQQSLGNNHALTISYVASAGRRLLLSQALNRSRTPPDYKLVPEMPSLTFIQNGPQSDYHSLQLQLQRRMSHGLQAIANYTWSRAIDDVSVDNDDRTLRRGDADFDRRHVFSAGISYQIPGWRSSRLLSAVTGGWSLDSLLAMSSAPPLDIEGPTVIFPDGSQVYTNPDIVEGVPKYLYDSSYPGGRRINPAAFSYPPEDGPARVGTLGRNVFRGFGLFQIDLSLQRRLKITNGMNLQLRVDAFNVLNRPNFGSVDREVDHGDSFGLANSMANSSFGSTTPGGGLSPLYSSGGPRSMQLSLRFSF